MPRKPAGLLYIFFLILLPLAYSRSSIDPALMPRQIFLSVFVILLAVLVLLKKSAAEFSQWKSPIRLAIGAYILISLIGFTFNPFTAESHAVLSKVLLLFGFLLLTVALLKAKAILVRDLILGAMGFGIVAIGSAGVQIFEKSVIGHQKLFRQIEIINGLFANKNLLASVLFLCLPFFLMGLQLHRKIKWLSILGIAAICFILLIIRTRTVLVATLLLGSILLYFYLRTRFKVRHAYLISGGILLAAGLFQTVKIPTKNEVEVTPSVSAHYADRVFETKTLKLRTTYWENSLEMLREHPIFGVGFGNWQVEFPKYGLEKLEDFDIVNGTLTLQRPHNDFLQVLCESGLLGWLFYLLIFCTIAYQLAALISKAATTAEWKFTYLLAGIAGYVVISMLDFPMERIEHQVLLMLIFAIVIFAFEDSQPNEPRASNNSKLPVYLLLIIAFYSGVVAGFRYYGEQQTAQMYAAKADSKWDDLLFYANAAQNKFYQTDPTSIPIDWYKGNAYFGRNESAESVASFEKAYAIAPYQIQVINNLATAYRVSRQTQKAERLYLETLKISPQFEEARFNLAGLYYNEHQFARAFTVIDSVDIDTKNNRYPQILVPILAHEINRILATHGNPELSTKVASKVKTREQIIRLYRNAKRENVSFEEYVTDPNGVFE